MSQTHPNLTVPSTQSSFGVTGMLFSVRVEPCFRIFHQFGVPQLKSLFHIRSIQASRSRISGFPQFQEGSYLVNDPHIWKRVVNSEFDDDDDDDERSLDLLVRFVHNVTKKVSKKARKAVRSVLPPSISTQLVAFYVNGVLVLSLLWVSKAFLEVVCTFGTVVFISILLIRGVWSGIAYLRESRNRKGSELEDEHHAWTRMQLVT